MTRRQNVESRSEFELARVRKRMTSHATRFVLVVVLFVVASAVIYPTDTSISCSSSYCGLFPSNKSFTIRNLASTKLRRQNCAIAQTQLRC